jgi:hypothetical protein
MNKPHEMNIETRPAKWKFDGAVNRQMYDSDFYRLHKAKYNPISKCPHNIIGICGSSPRPRSLYRQYSKLLSGLAPESPVDYMLLGRAINVALLLFVLTVIFTAGNFKLFNGFVVSLMLFGGYLAQMSSITNDFPMFAYGILSAFMLIQTVYNPKIGSILFVFLAATGSVIYGFDESFLSAALIAAVFLILLITKLHKLKGDKRKLRFIPPDKEAMFFTAAGFLGMIFVFWLCMVLIETNILKEMLSKVPRGLLVWQLSSGGFSNAPKYMYEILRSFFGSYIWGHSHFSDLTYFILSAIYGALACSGLKIIFPKHVTRMFLTGLGAAFGVYVICHLAISMDGSAENLRIASSKIRFTAVAAGLLLFLPVFSLEKVLEKYSKIIGGMVFSWLVFFQLFYQFRFSFIDIY